MAGQERLRAFLLRLLQDLVQLPVALRHFCARRRRRGQEAPTYLHPALEPILARSVPYWGRQIVKAIPMSTINKMNKVMGPRFITKYGTKQGLVVLGIQLPFLIGSAVGGAGNGLFGWFVVKAAKRILGPPPETWDAPVAS